MLALASQRMQVAARHRLRITKRAQAAHLKYLEVHVRFGMNFQEEVSQTRWRHECVEVNNSDDHGMRQHIVSADFCRHYWSEHLVRD